MTNWLASVQSLNEAESLADCLPDILDLKNPAMGALGALPVNQVTAIVDWVDDRCQTSATVGDLPMQAELVGEAISAMAATGVDYVKVGLFASPTLPECIKRLQTTLASVDRPVIAVLFADQMQDVSLLTAIKQAGFAGVMLDTASKNGQGLLEHWTLAELQRFVETARHSGLLCGLAGALQITDIDALEALNADYLGFRSALCDNQQRTRRLDPARARVIRHRLRRFVLAS